MSPRASNASLGVYMTIKIEESKDYLMLKKYGDLTPITKAKRLYARLHNMEYSKNEWFMLKDGFLASHYVIDYRGTIYALGNEYTELLKSIMERQDEC